MCTQLSGKDIINLKNEMNTKLDTKAGSAIICVADGLVGSGVGRVIGFRVVWPAASRGLFCGRHGLAPACHSPAQVDNVAWKEANDDLDAAIKTARVSLELRQRIGFAQLSAPETPDGRAGPGHGLLSAPGCGCPPAQGEVGLVMSQQRRVAEELFTEPCMARMLLQCASS